MVVRVSLDGERLRGKQQTLCIDLDKILGSKFGLTTRYELQRLAVNAPDSYLTEVQAAFTSYTTNM